MSICYGECDISGLMKIDYLKNSEDELYYTIIHEFVHSKLTESTSYGQILFLMQMVCELDNSYSKIFNILNKNMIKTQEIIANTIEYILYYDENGKEEFNKKLNLLKLNNNKYYKYIKEFNFLFEENRLNMEDKIRIVFYMGYECLNVNFIEINVELFNKHNKLKKYIENQKNSIKYLPKTRLDELIKNLKSYLKENEELDLNKISDIIFSFRDNGNFYDKNKSISIIEYVKSIVSNSSYNNEINVILNNMKIVDTDIEDLYNLSIYPLNDDYKTIEITHKEFMDLKFSVETVIFCSLHVSKSKLLDSINKKKFVLDEFKCLYTNIESKTDYIITDLDLVKILNDKKNIKVIDFISYLMLDTGCSPLKYLKNEELYVISNIPYSMFKIYFKEVLSKNYKYRLFSFKGFNTIIVSLEDNIKLLMLMDELSYLKFLDDLSNNQCNFKLNFTSKDNPYDNLIIKSEEDEYIYNLIINAYLRT